MKEQRLKRKADGGESHPCGAPQQPAEAFIEENHYKNLPRVFNLNISNIRKLNLVKELEIDFGEQKSLLEWLVNYAK